MKTTRATILGWILVPLLLAMVGTFFLSSFLLQTSVATQIDDQLAQEAKELSLLAKEATDPESDSPYTSSRELLELYLRNSVPDSNETLFVLVDGKVISRSSGSDLPRLDRAGDFIEMVSTLQEPLVSNYLVDGESVRFIAIPVSGPADSGHMVAAIFVEEKLDAVNATLTQLGLLMLLAFMAAASAGWFVAGRILKPIRQLGEITRRITDGTTPERLEGFDKKSELGAIAADFNSMLDRTSSAFASQRRFVDDAGHELKTPLTIVRGHLDLMKTAPKEAETSLAIIEDEVQRMTRIVKDLQLLTKSTEASFIKTSPVQPSEIVDEVFVKTSPLANRRWDVEAEITPALEIDRQRMVQALLQLVDNSIKHTNDEDAIVIGCRSIGSFVELFVGDSGPGIPEEARIQVQQRFVRGGWTAEDTEGSGLGLAIVDAIARGHMGELYIKTSELGGAEVGIRLNSNKKLKTGDNS